MAGANAVAETVVSVAKLSKDGREGEPTPSDVTW